MSHSKSIVVVYLAAGFALAGCQKKAPAGPTPTVEAKAPSFASIPGDPLVKLDEHVITVEDVEAQLAEQPAEVRARYNTPEAKTAFVDNLVRFELLAMEAKRKGFDKDREIVRMMKQQMISKYIDKEVPMFARPESVPDAELEKYYAEHKAEFNQTEAVRLSEIVVKDEKLAKQVAKEAKKAAKATDFNPFRALVLKYTQDEESKNRSGDLGLFERATPTVAKPIIDAGFAIKNVGDTVGPVKTERGFHILQLTHRRPEMSKTLADVAPDVRGRVFREQRTRSMDALVEALRKRTKVEVDTSKMTKIKVDGTVSPTNTAPSIPSAPASGTPAAPTPHEKPVANN